MGRTLHVLTVVALGLLSALIAQPAHADRVSDPDAYRAWDAYRPNAKYEPIRLPDSVIDNIRRAEQESGAAAWRGTLTAKPPAPVEKPRDPAAEAAAWAWLEAEAARIAQDKKSDAEFNDRMRRKRAAVIARMQAAAGEIAARGSVTPDDFDRLVGLSAPEWDWMSYWAEEGYRAFPKEFALRRAVMMTIGCPEISYLEYKRQGKRCAPDRYEQGFVAIQAVAQDGNPLDRLLACGFQYARLGLLDSAADRVSKADQNRGLAMPWQAVQPGRLFARQVAEHRARDAEVLLRIQACEAALAPIPAGLRDSVLGQMWRSGPTILDSEYNITTRWFLVSADAWRGVRSLSDREQVAAVIAQAPKYFDWHQYQYAN